MEGTARGVQVDRKKHRTTGAGERELSRLWRRTEEGDAWGLREAGAAAEGDCAAGVRHWTAAATTDRPDGDEKEETDDGRARSREARRDGGGAPAASDHDAAEAESEETKSLSTPPQQVHFVTQPTTFTVQGNL